MKLLTHWDFKFKNISDDTETLLKSIWTNNDTEILHRIRYIESKSKLFEMWIKICNNRQLFNNSIFQKMTIILGSFYYP